MDTPSPARSHPVVLKVLSVTVALGFLGTVMCTAGGSGPGAPQPVAARPAASDGGSADSGTAAVNTKDGKAPKPERFFPATKSGALEVLDEAPPPEQQEAPQREAPQQDASQQGVPR
ncbi:hypothetical protein ACN28E_46915 [Archangium lansingense]|uniref:hypothetical protein n=1 Tax=Archangium lansingense TaxID=2995310 RepID=UPI003B7AD1E2